MNTADLFRNLPYGPLWLRLVVTPVYVLGIAIVPAYTGLDWTQYFMWLALLLAWVPLDPSRKWPLTTRIGMFAIAAAFGAGMPEILAQHRPADFIAMVMLLAWALGFGKWKQPLTGAAHNE